MWLVGLRGVAHNEFEGGFSGSRVRPGVVYILSKWEPLMPSGLTVVDEDAEILFKPLVGAFGLAVGLGVVGGAYVLFDVEDAAELLQEVGSEAGIPVHDNFAGSAVVRENMLDVKVGDGRGGGRFVAGDEDGSF